MSKYDIILGSNFAERVPYPSLGKAEEALADGRHGGGCCIEIVVPYDEAVKIIDGIRTRKRTLYIAASHITPLVHEDKSRRVFGHAPVTRGGMLRYLDDAYSKSIRASVAVQIRIYDNCLFLGSNY